MKCRKTICILLLLTACAAACAQDSVVTKKQWEINGYIKNLESLQFDKNFDQLISGNLLHNRINAKWKPNDRLTAAIEIRNRFFWGDEVKSVPGFAGRLRNQQEWLNLSAVWISRSNFVAHTNIERLWMEYRHSAWNIRAGRQRINWGMATTWNPNDIFNTYNFLDFDYEERPGSDAVKIQYLLSYFSHLELAASSAHETGRSIAATRFFINRWGYDLQVLAGIYENNFTTGFGWAGSLGNIGYKGEGQAFFYSKDSGVSFNYTMEFSYAFKKGWYLSGSVLHNTNGINKPVTDWSNLNLQVSPANLMPARWSIITTASKEFTPLLSGNISVVYSPGMNLLIAYPALKYNLATNLDADFVWQSFFLELQRRMQAASHRTFLRIKWNF